MKFFWKIFLSIMLIVSTFFSIGIYYIIHSSFKYSLEREITAAYEENEILLYSLNSELQSTFKIAQKEMTEDGSLKNEWVNQTANSMVISTSNGVVPFRISDSSFRILYQSKWVGIDSSLLAKLPANSRGYEIIYLNEFYYIHTAAPITVLDETLYVENFRNITVLFENRNQQYRTCSYLMIIMLAVSAAVVFVVSTWLTRPIRQLSRATKCFANGNFNQRVKINGEDELASLSQDFNVMAEHLDQTVKELKDATRRQENFVSSFAHELKTPLTSMIGYADMLRSKKLGPEQIILSASYIFEEGKRLEALSMKLMNLIVLKKQEFTFRRVNMRSFIQSIDGVVRPIFEKANIDLTVSCDNAVVQMEPDLMKTVCFNLLDNAKKAITDVGEVCIIGKKTVNGYSISVYDNGRGMEESELVRITEAFYMVDKSRARSQGGAGLGLSICSEIVKLHGGTLTFESEFGKGTCATIYLKGANPECQN